METAQCLDHLKIVCVYIYYIIYNIYIIYYMNDPFVVSSFAGVKAV